MRPKARTCRSACLMRPGRGTHHRAGSTSSDVFPGGGPWMWAQTTCPGVLTRRRTSGEDARSQGREAVVWRCPGSFGRSGGRRTGVRHIRGRVRGHGHAIWRVWGVLWTRQLVTGVVTSHGAGDMAGAMSLAGGPLVKVQMTCPGDQTCRGTSGEDVQSWGATPLLGGILAVSARLGVVSPVFGAPRDVPESTNTSFNVFGASQGQ